MNIELKHMANIVANHQKRIILQALNLFSIYSRCSEIKTVTRQGQENDNLVMQYCNNIFGPLKIDLKKTFLSFIFIIVRAMNILITLHVCLSLKHQQFYKWFKPNENRSVTRHPSSRFVKLK